MIRVIVGCTEPEALRVRAAAIAAYEDARLRRWPFSSDILERALRSSGIAEEDGGALRSTVHALIKYHRLLVFAAQGDDAELHFDTLFALARGEGREIDARIEHIDRRTERLGVAWSFPDWMVERIGEEVGEEAVEPALARMNELAPRVARANSLRSTRDEVLRALAEEGLSAQPTTHSPHGIAFDGHGSPFRTRAFARGDFELQDEASQLVAEVVAPPPGSLVIDACAGAGGKTLALAALLAGKGRIVALDASENKLAELRRRARRAGAHNVQAVAVDLLDPAKLADVVRRSGGPASRVLLDAPCSGFGAIRRNPEARWRLGPADLDRMVEAQRALMNAAASLVGMRGRLVFATCSFLPSEGERTVERFLADRRDFASVTVRDVLGRARTTSLATSDGRFLRTWRFDGRPEGANADMDGFFAAVVRRVGERGGS
jgi:16S rRNA (cytosine967-C5)-methyltransferase